MATEETASQKPKAIPPAIAISPATAGITSTLLTPRYIPGAPPPSAKPAKKKRAKAPGSKAKSADGDTRSDREITDAHSAALIDTAPTSEDIKEGRVAKELLSERPASAVGSAHDPKPASPTIESLNKRMKNYTKRISRITPTVNKDPTTLNEDQKRNLALLPSMESALKELEEVKKSLITIESEQEEKLALQKEEQDLAYQRDVKTAVAAAEANTVTKINFVLSFLSLSSALSSQSIPITIPLDDIERSAISRAGDLLLNSEDASQRDEIVNGLLEEGTIGEIDGVPYARLHAITKSFIHPPTPIASPALEAIDSAAEPSSATVQPPISSNVSDIGESAAPPSFTESAPGPGSSFQFMQESDLEHPSGSLTFGAVTAMDDSGILTAVESSFDTGTGDASANLAKEWVEVEKDQEQYPISGEEQGTTAAAAPGPIDWAADDAEELPSIDTLHAKFGTSGQATPVESDQPSSTPAAAPLNGESGEPGTPLTPSGDSEWRSAGGGGPGFRGRGHRGFRGGYRGDGGEYRGRGGRGGEGGYRGRGPRGGEGEEGREGGSGFRGGRGSFGNWKNRQGDGGSTPPTPTTAGPDDDGWTPAGGNRQRTTSGFRGRGGYDGERRGGYDGPRRGGFDGERRGGFDGERRGRGGFRGRPPHQSAYDATPLPATPPPPSS